MDRVWQICINSLVLAQSKHPAIISQFVLMANHYHLLIKTPQSDIDKFMYIFNKEFSTQLRSQSMMTNRMFGSNYKWSLIQNQNYFNNVFRYIYQNPLRANLTERCEDYPYSTCYYRKRRLCLSFEFTAIDELESDLEYLNSVYGDDQALGIRKGLRKAIFSYVFHRG